MNGYQEQTVVLVELHSEAEAQSPVSSVHLSVKVSKEGSASPCLCHNSVACCIWINPKSD